MNQHISPEKFNKFFLLVISVVTEYPARPLRYSLSHSLSFSLLFLWTTFPDSHLSWTVNGAEINPKPSQQPWRGVVIDSLRRRSVCWHEQGRSSNVAHEVPSSRLQIPQVHSWDLYAVRSLDCDWHLFVFFPFPFACCRPGRSVHRSTPFQRSAPLSSGYSFSVSCHSVGGSFFMCIVTQFTMELASTESGNAPRRYAMVTSKDFVPMSVFSESLQGILINTPPKILSPTWIEDLHFALVMPLNVLCQVR